MKKQYIYIVTFEIHRNCQIWNYVFHCEAKNAKDACALARRNWKMDAGHQFHIHATRSRISDRNLLKVRTWKNTTVDGLNCMDRYIMIDCKTWRFKASDGTYRYPLCKAY